MASRKEKLQQYLQTLLELPLLRASALLQAFLAVTIVDAVLCKTLTTCPICTMIARKPPTAILAQWLRVDGRVLQQASCTLHGQLNTLLSDDAEAYQGTALQPLHLLCDAVDPGASPLNADVSTAALHDVSLGHDAQPTEPSALADIIATLNPNERAGARGFTRTLVRFDGMRFKHASNLNEAMKTALSLTSKQRVSVCASPDRMQALADLPDSVLLNPRVYPSLRLHLRRGYETQTRQDLVGCLGSLAAYEDVSVAIELLVEQPYPELGLVLQSVLRHKAMLRWVGVALSRSSSQLMKVRRGLVMGLRKLRRLGRLKRPRRLAGQTEAGSCKYWKCGACTLTTAVVAR